jgi:hypothetical protein
MTVDLFCFLETHYYGQRRNSVATCAFSPQLPIQDKTERRSVGETNPKRRPRNYKEALIAVPS